MIYHKQKRSAVPWHRGRKPLDPRDCHHICQRRGSEREDIHRPFRSPKASLALTPGARIRRPLTLQHYPLATPAPDLMAEQMESTETTNSQSGRQSGFKFRRAAPVRLSLCSQGMIRLSRGCSGDRSYWKRRECPRVTSCCWEEHMRFNEK